MFDLLDEREFYNATLQESGIEPKDDGISKFAERAGVPIKVAELAKRFFEQLQLDGVPYESEQKRAADAMEMAKSFYQHIDEAKTAATKIADGLARFLTNAVEGYLAENKIALTPLEALKVAGLQADSQLLLEDERLAVKAAAARIIDARGKTASAVAEEAPAAATGAPAPAAAPAVFQGDAVYANNTPHPNNLLVHESMKSLAPHVPDADRQGYVMKHLGVADAAQLGPAIHNYSEAGRELGAGATHVERTNLLKSMQNQPGFIARNKGMLAAGAVGAGALYLLHRRNQDAQDQRARQAQRAAALPPA